MFITNNAHENRIARLFLEVKTTPAIKLIINNTGDITDSNHVEGTNKDPNRIENRETKNNSNL